jgi:hypothetical protein
MREWRTAMRSTRATGFLSTGIAAALACLLALPCARAAENKTLVGKGEAHLILDMPGLGQSRETLQTLGWDAAYPRRVFFAAQVARTAASPRAQVYYLELAPNRLAVAQNDVTEACLAASDIADILGGWRTLGTNHELLVDGRLYAKR